jgi:hypothetical protein
MAHRRSAPDVPTVLHDFCPDCSGRVEVRTNAVRVRLKSGYTGRFFFKKSDEREEGAAGWLLPATVYHSSIHEILDNRIQHNAGQFTSTLLPGNNFVDCMTSIES